MAQNRAGSGQALDSSLPTVFSEFKINRDETGIMRSCATHMRLRPHEGASKNVNNYDRVVAYGLDDAADMTQAQELADTTTSYTPGEAGVQVVLPGSTMRRIQDPDLLSRTGRIMANAYDLKEDQDGCNQLSSYGGGLGGSSSVLSPGLARAIGARLRVGNSQANPEPAPAPWYMVTNPLSGVVLEGRLIPLGSTPGGAAVYGATGGAHAGTTAGVGSPNESMAAEIIKRGIGGVGTISNMMVKYDANLLPDGNDDVIMAGFSQEGLVFVSEVNPHPDHDRSDKSMRGAVELNFWGSYVWGVYKASNYGVDATVDASLPTT